MILFCQAFFSRLCTGLKANGQSKNTLCSVTVHYLCRVDFAAAPTRMSNILLEVIVPPEKPRITDESNEEVRLKLGPYRLGDTVTITCEVNKRFELVSIYFDLQLFLPSYCHSSRKLTIFKKLESNLRFFVEYFHQSLCHSAHGIVDCHTGSLAVLGAGPHWRF